MDCFFRWSASRDFRTKPPCVAFCAASLLKLSGRSRACTINSGRSCPPCPSPDRVWSSTSTRWSSRSMESSKAPEWATIPRRKDAPPIIRCCALKLTARSFGTDRCVPATRLPTRGLALWSGAAWKKFLREWHDPGFVCWPIRDSFPESWLPGNVLWLGGGRVWFSTPQMGSGASVHHGAATAAGRPRGGPAIEPAESGSVRLLGFRDQPGVAALDDLEDLPGASQCGKVRSGAPPVFLAEQNSHAKLGGQRGLPATAASGIQSGPLVQAAVFA